ncbi:hypothetical protein SCLARK_001534 [Spiroplasma clarkii]|uniref:ECF transporter S component n=1 Tax=Spiroplasma clarkii TaxID=2139 RepID=A0A1Y0L1Z6_9MOLU|nr:hypothetical protein [Spiroplasma clarkii]ARU92044.1 hypothetical protein SCLARK_001534 [Spiroplasma clarkii]ATX71371.1 hypothetical protein SCLAR_v1c10710 [Spiroplasma clarkii]
MKNIKNQDKLTISEVDLEDEAQLVLHLKQIKRQELQQYFGLSIFRITLLGMLTAINIILALISFYVLGLFPIFTDFLKLEITFLSYLIIWVCVNGFYALILITPLTWFRLTFMPTNEVIGLLALNLGDIVTLAVFILVMFILKLVFNRQDTKSMYWQLAVASVITIIIANLWNIFANFTFIFRLYGDDGSYNTWEMAGFLLAFNTTKLAIVFALFMAMFGPLRLALRPYVEKI